MPIYTNNNANALALAQGNILNKKYIMIISICYSVNIINEGDFRHREECRGSHLIFSLTVVMNQGKRIVHTYSYNSYGDSQ